MANRSQLVFTVGGELSDGRIFEAGQDVPNDIIADDLAALKEMEAIEVKNG